ncbi:MAG: hypothetical protein AAAB35_14950 [Phyllobacterium sp.]|uniref:hypothetical protein n=1 Tax=Phyllobacterium sp. TaxID=1871046 RepID=UPI0030F0F6A5
MLIIASVYIGATWLVFFKFKLLSWNFPWRIVYHPSPGEGFRRIPLMSAPRRRRLAHRVISRTIRLLLGSEADIQRAAITEPDLWVRAPEVGFGATAGF